jgi:erythromycin esterase-like protein
VSLDRWIEENAISLDAATLEPVVEGSLARIDETLARARLVFLGETNHFVREKTEFRLWWLRRIARTGKRIVLAEELSWSDGHDVSRYLESGDETHLARAATFGDRRHEREDRDDRPTGVFAASFETYPHDAMLREHTRFYRGVRELGSVTRFFGFDVDAPGAGYEDVLAHRDDPDLPDAFWERLERRTGESLDEEIERLESVLDTHPGLGKARMAHLEVDAMIASLRYTALINPATDYEALRPGMALREQVMKRHVERALYPLTDDEVLVVLSHAFHLAKDDARVSGPGVGPGGGLTVSLGHHLTNDLGLDAFSAWFVYGRGTDSQPLPELPRSASYPSSSLNAKLAEAGAPLVVPVDERAGDVEVGHMFDQIANVHLPSETDAIFFVPDVSPLGS